MNFKSAVRGGGAGGGLGGGGAGGCGLGGGGRGGGDGGIGGGQSHEHQVPYISTSIARSFFPGAPVRLYLFGKNPLNPFGGGGPGGGFGGGGGDCRGGGGGILA